MKRVAIAATALLCAWTHTPEFRLSSAAFSAGGVLPNSTVLNGLDCRGPNISPALEWSDAPAGTKSFALILDDYEARGGDGFIHWSSYTPEGVKVAKPSEQAVPTGRR
jgi:phosphatidylethanolamine-binding protein (PEBP) family uncharacterized protein